MALDDRNPTDQDDIIVGEHDPKKLKKSLIAAGAMVAIGSSLAAAGIFTDIESQARVYLLLVSLGIVALGGLLGSMGWHHFQNPRYFALNASGAVEWTPYFTTRKFNFEPGTRPIINRSRLIWPSQPVDAKLPQNGDSKPYIDIPESVILRQRH